MKRYLLSLTILTSIIIPSGFLLRAAFTASTIADNATYTTSYFEPGSTNNLIASILLPDPVVDTLITNGATAVIAPGDTLSDFGSNHSFIDANGDGDYDDGEGVIADDGGGMIDQNSPGQIVTVSEGALTAFPSTPAETTEGTTVGWVKDGASTTYVSSDIGGTLVRNAASATDGLTIRLFPTDIAYLADSNNADYSIANDNAIVEDTDADGYISAGDTVLLAGPASVHRFDSSDNICFDGSVSNDSEYDVGEIIWKDFGGDCSSFTSTTDIILVGASTPSGTSTEFGTENEVGYMDGDSDNAYDCTRGGDCEGIVYSGANATDLTTDGSLSTSASFFDGSSEATDGVRTVSDSWDESGNALETIVFFDDKEDTAQKEYFYIDADTNSDFTATDPVAVAILVGNAPASGNTWRTFYDNGYHFYDRNDDGYYRLDDTGRDALILSDDTTFDGDDTVVLSEQVGGDGTAALTLFESISFDYSFHDHDSSGSYADGDDIIDDNDANDLYNADDLISLTISNDSGSIEDADIDGFYVYEQTGASCAGSGTDTLLGSDTSAPMLGQSITITKSPYDAADSVASRTICLYIDIDANATLSDDFDPELATVFASGTVTGTSDIGGSSSNHSISELITVTPSATTLVPSETATYTFTYTTGSASVPIGSNVLVFFPSGFDVSGSSISCTDDGGNISGGETVQGQLVGLAEITDAIASGSDIICTITNVVNPADEGETGHFIVAPVNGMSPYFTDPDVTVTIATASSSSSGSSTPFTVTEPKTYDINLTAPTEEDVYSYEDDILIRWDYTGTGSIGYVDLEYSLDAGRTYKAIVNATENDGAYIWEGPHDSSANLYLRVSTSDLETRPSNDVVSEIQILGESGELPPPPVVITPDPDIDQTVCEGKLPEGIQIGDYLLGQNPDGSVYPAVYYIADDCKRHPFLNEATYYTYQSDFSVVETISIATLAEMMEGQTMPVNPGTIMVKSPESPVVYYVHGVTGDIKPELIPIMSEEEALEYFGISWNQSILDIPQPLLNLHTKTTKSVSEVLTEPVQLLNRFLLGQ